MLLPLSVSYPFDAAVHLFGFKSALLAAARGSGIPSLDGFYLG